MLGCNLPFHQKNCPSCIFEKTTVVRTRRVQLQAHSSMVTNTQKSVSLARLDPSVLSAEGEMPVFDE